MKYSNRKTYKPKRKTSKRKTAKKSVSISAIVKRELHKNIENKDVIDYQVNLPIRLAGALLGVYTTPTTVSLLPQPPQGTGQGGRIGNQIKLMKGVIRGHVNCLPYNATTNPFPAPLYIKMWLISIKQANTNTISSSSINTSFFETGNSSIGFQSNMLDVSFRVNTELFTVYASKTVKVGVASGNSNSSQPFNNQYIIPDNSPFSLPFSFNWGKHYKQMLKYDDATTNVCTNRNCFLVFQAVTATGSSDINSTSAFAEVHYVNEVQYEDA